MYLRLSKPLDPAVLEKSWIHAVELSQKFCGPEKVKETVKSVCAKLVEINRYDSAADVYANAGEMYKEAIDCCAAGNLWDKARDIGKLSPKYKEYADKLIVENAKKSGNADKMISVDAAGGLEMYAQRGEWKKCLEAAATQGPEVLLKYLLSFCSLMIKESKYEQAVQQVVKSGVPMGMRLHPSNLIQALRRLMCTLDLPVSFCISRLRKQCRV
jgi:intraflagellar transport protein 172